MASKLPLFSTIEISDEKFVSLYIITLFVNGDIFIYLAFINKYGGNLYLPGENTKHLFFFDSSNPCLSNVSHITTLSGFIFFIVKLFN